MLLFILNTIIVSATISNNHQVSDSPNKAQEINDTSSNDYFHSPSSSEEQRIIRKQGEKEREQFEYERFKVLDSYFEESQKNFPMTISGMIKDYDFNKSLIDLFKAVMDGLNVVTPEERNGLNPESELFIVDFYHILKKRNLENYSNHFKHNIARLVFKWIIYLRRTFKNNLNEVIKRVQNEYDSVKGIVGLWLFVLDDSGKSDQWYYSGSGLSFLFLEIIDRGEDIFTLYHSVIEEFYMKSGSCQKILSEFFDGHFDNDIILKFMLLRYNNFGDPNGIVKCFTDPIYQMMTTENMTKKMKVQPTPESIKDRFIEEFHSTNIYFNMNVVEFYKRNSISFKIEREFQLYSVSMNLIEANLLRKDILKEIVTFPSLNKWNEKLFKIYLKKSRSLWKKDHLELFDLLEQSN
jgi:hypothetical protein